VEKSSSKKKPNFLEQVSRAASKGGIASKAYRAAKARLKSNDYDKKSLDGMRDKEKDIRTVEKFEK
jgi:hypothetical protein